MGNAKAIGWFAAGSLAVFLLASVAAVTLADGGWEWGVFRLLCGVSVAATVLLLVGLGLGALVSRRVPQGSRAAWLGAGCAGAFVAMVALAAWMAVDPTRSMPLLIALPVLGGVASLLGRRG